MLIELEVSGIGAALKAERVVRNLKLYQVAGRIGMEPSRLRNIERGRTEPSAELVTRIRQAIRG